jgi:heme-degrading monooxygenase HmoA
MRNVNSAGRKECIGDMYAILRRIKIQPQLVGEAIRRTEHVFLPVLSNEPGFIEFYSIQIGENEALSVSLFETKEQAEEGNRKAFEWAKEQLFPLAQGPASIVGMGDVLLHQKKEPQREGNMA